MSCLQYVKASLAWTTKMLDVSLVELSKGEYVLAIMMLTKQDSFGNWTERHMCGDSCLVNKWTNLDKYTMPFWMRSLMPLVKPRFSIPWTGGLVTIHCHWRRVTRSKQHFGELIPMGNIFYTNGNFCHLVWKMPLHNFRESWIEYWWVLVSPSATLMT